MTDPIPIKDLLPELLATIEAAHEAASSMSSRNSYLDCEPLARDELSLRSIPSELSANRTAQQTA